MSPNDKSRMRISDAERDQVAEILREAAGEGRLDLDELDERLSAVYAAKTYADLEPIVFDLPTGANGLGGPETAGPAAGAALPAFGAGPLAGGQPLVLKAQGNPVVRKGEWTVPHRVEVDARFNNTKLDFRRARLTTPVVEVWLDTSWGSADLILPEGATAEVDVDSSWFGSLRSDVDSIRRSDAPHFVITGKSQGGTLRVRHKKQGGWADLFG
ncbi:hypothetical protein GCM10007079_45730 [Nocardiopsis terrae]|uniref:DUF1707 domain-containing protein n=1 Tax=Nocardiopsis terrae TaxID=372655 RepID=A0ABR9HKT0_9ACTN|nr:DUF1707 domain-containing protein [Nocardiopsis terrae]MBE1459617.1 hypothetical protein [Nocardiopsis terrae]GHC94851.1 hypothetical protein GCM10007079_45730 [Nocardiopsis terrae]